MDRPRPLRIKNTREEFTLASLKADADDEERNTISDERSIEERRRRYCTSQKKPELSLSHSLLAISNAQTQYSHAGCVWYYKGLWSRDIIIELNLSQNAGAYNWTRWQKPTTIKKYFFLALKITQEDLNESYSTRTLLLIKRGKILMQLSYLS